jgi:hypothetical protein
MHSNRTHHCAAHSASSTPAGWLLVHEPRERCIMWRVALDATTPRSSRVTPLIMTGSRIEMTGIRCANDGVP